MKSNREIADSVFEKSRVVLEKRAKRRKVVTAAGSALGLVAVVTAAVVITKSAPSGNINIPTQSAPDIESSASSSFSAPSESSSVFRIFESSTAEASSSESTSHEAEKDNSTDPSEASSKKNTARTSSTSSIKTEQRTTTTHTTQNNDEDPHESSSKTTSSKTTSSRTTSSKTTSSKTTSSKTTSSRTTSSRTTSSKTTSSAAISSKPVSSENDKTGEKPTSPSSLVPDVPITDSDNETMTDIDQNEGDPGKEEVPIPDSPNPPEIEPTTDGETDSEAVADDDFYNVYYYNEVPYTSANQLMSVSDKMIVGIVRKIDYVSLDQQYDFLLDNIEKPDIPQDDSESDYGDLVAMYTIEIQEDLTAGDGDSSGDTISLYVYGGSQYGNYYDQEWATGIGKKIPVVENMKQPEIGGNYIFALKNHGDIVTLVNYDQSIYAADDFYDYDYFGQITTGEIYTELRY